MGFYNQINALEEIPCFNIDKEQLYTGHHVKIDGLYSLRNLDRNAHLGVVTKQYRPIQLDEMVSVLSTAFKEADVRPVGWVDAWNGRRVIIQSEIDYSKYFNDGDDNYDTYLYTIIDNSGKGANRFVPSTIRTRCDNQLHAILRKGQVFRFQHSSSFDEKVFKTLANVKSTLKAFQQFGDNVSQLRLHPFNTDNMTDLALKLFGEPEIDKQQEKIDCVVNLFSRGTAVEGKTKYDALNAVTEYNTHYRTKRTESVLSHIRGLDGYTSITRKAYNILQNG